MGTHVVAASHGPPESPKIAVVALRTPIRKRLRNRCLDLLPQADVQGALSYRMHVHDCNVSFWGLT